MGRPRAFDTNKTLRTIMELFWRQGFDRTSFADIETATGLKKASLFAAYGNKETIFAKALALYQAERGGNIACLCSHGSPKRALRDWLRSMACIATSKQKEPGCFMTNTLTELSVHGQICSRSIRLHFKSMESSLVKLLKKGVANSEFRRNLDLKITVKYLITIVTGLQTLSKSPQTLDCSSKDIEKLIDVAMKALE